MPHQHSHQLLTQQRGTTATLATFYIKDRNSQLQITTAYSIGSQVLCPPADPMEQDDINNGLMYRGKFRIPESIKEYELLVRTSRCIKEVVDLRRFRYIELVFMYLYCVYLRLS